MVFKKLNQVIFLLRKLKFFSNKPFMYVFVYSILSNGLSLWDNKKSITIKVQQRAVKAVSDLHGNTLPCIMYILNSFNLPREEFTFCIQNALPQSTILVGPVFLQTLAKNQCLKKNGVIYGSIKIFNHFPSSIRK